MKKEPSMALFSSSKMFSDKLIILIFCLFLYLHSFLWLDIPYSIHLEVLLHLVNTVYILMQISVFHLLSKVNLFCLATNEKLLPNSKRNFCK